MDKIRYDMIVINLTILCYIILFIASIKEDLTPYASTMIQTTCFFSPYFLPPSLACSTDLLVWRKDEITYIESLYALYA